MAVLNTPAIDARKWKIARSFPRFAIDEATSITGPSLAAPLAGRAIDIGLGGICIVIAEQRLRGGEQLWIEFWLPQVARPLRVLAKLRYAAGERHGFQFLNLTPDQREQIRSACENLVIV